MKVAYQEFKNEAHITTQATDNSRLYTHPEFSRMLSYNINDYLPEMIEQDISFNVPNYISMFRPNNSHNTQEYISQVQFGTQSSVLTPKLNKNQTQDRQSLLEEQAKISELEMNNTNLCKEIEALKKQIQQLQHKAQQQKDRWNAQISQGQSKIVEFEKIISQLQLKNREIERQCASKSQVLSKLEADRKRSLSRIQLFSHKFEVNIVPAIKHFYQIEVQTDDRQLLSDLPHPKELLIPKIAAIPAKREIQGKNSMVVTSNEAPFYQLFQREKYKQQFLKSPPPFGQVAAQDFDLNGHPTTRSQVLTTGYKHLKASPMFMENLSDLNRHKEGQQKKNNTKQQQVRGWKEALSCNKERKRISIQIGCIKEEDLKDMINSIMNY